MRQMVQHLSQTHQAMSNDDSLNVLPEWLKDKTKVPGLKQT